MINNSSSLIVNLLTLTVHFPHNGLNNITLQFSYLFIEWNWTSNMDLLMKRMKLLIIYLGILSLKEDNHVSPLGLPMKTRRSILGSDGSTLWMLDCSLRARLLFDCSLSALWPRKMKIDCSLQVCAAQTDGRTLWLLELLSEPKMHPDFVNKFIHQMAYRKW